MTRWPKRPTARPRAEIPIEIMAPDGSHSPGWLEWARANGWSAREMLLEARNRRRAWYGVAARPEVDE